MEKPEIPFVEFPKMSRFSREIIITEKIDGTNASIYIPEDSDEIYAASRSKWITPKDDNYGFAGWVERNKQELLKLGHGHHFGEWWGNGIQRGYGIKEKRFSLFNVVRWADDTLRPSCCSVVPELWRGIMESPAIEAAILTLSQIGSLAAPGFMNPEGIVIWHTAANIGFKKTILKDELNKYQIKS